METQMEFGNSDRLRRFRTDVLVEALVEGRIAEAEALIEHWIGRGSSYEDIAVQGIQASMIRIGELWEEGQVTVAQEHLATAISHRLLVRAFDAETFSHPRKQKAMFACVEGNRHALGLRIVSDTFSIAGWDIAYLGADVPTVDLMTYVERQRPHLLGLSATLAEHLHVALEVAQALHAELMDRAPRIVIGGRAVREHAGAPPQFAVDLWRYDATRSLAHL